MADRILTMAENQSNHRMGLETHVTHWDTIRSFAGLGAGLAVAIGFLIGGVYLVTEGYTYEGTIISTVDIASLAGVFVYGTKSRKDERERRAEILSGARK